MNTKAKDIATETEETEQFDSIYSMFGTDHEMEKRGMIVDFGSAGKILIARAGGANSAFAKVFEAKTRPHRRSIDLGIMDDKLANELLMAAFAETVVLGWEGIKNKKGKLIPFNKKNAIELFTDLPDLFIAVREEAVKMANFKTLEIEDDSGN